MAVLGRRLVGSQQRVDLSDFLSFDSYVASDFRHLIKTWTGDTPLVLKGFDVINAPGSIGSTSISIQVANSVLYSSASQAGSFFFGLEEGNELAQPLVPNLRPDATNYVYLILTTVGRGQDSRAFWDVDLNGGQGGEFNQDINTESVLSVEVGVSTSTFPDGTIPVCKVSTSGSSIDSIEDCRNMMFRLASGGVNPDPTGRYTFRNLPNANYSRNEPPNTVYTSTAPNPFFGGDKNIFTMKEWMDVVMTKLLELSGTTYWYESSENMSIANLFDDVSGSNIKSKGRWSHDLSTPGRITWSEDIHYKKMNDIRDIIIRKQDTLGVDLDDNEVLFIEMVRDVAINTTDQPVDWYFNAPYVDGVVGAFENLKVGDWVKKQYDDNHLYCRVTGFFAGMLPTTPALATQITLETPYQGTDDVTRAVYTKGEYQLSDLGITDRNDSSLQMIGGNFYWLANRSDTIMSVADITPTIFSGSVDIIEANGTTAKLLFPSPHGLNDGDRVTISGTTIYDGIQQVEVIDSTHVSFKTTTIGGFIGATISYAVVTTTSRDMVLGFELESASHSFEANQTIYINGIAGYDGAYLINTRSITTFQIPVPSTVVPVSGVGTATCVRVNLRTEFGSARIIQGESIDINEPDTQNILSFIGMDTLAQTSPVYQVPAGYNTLNGMQNFNADDVDSLTIRASRLTAMMADRVQDRGMMIIGSSTFRNEMSGAYQVVKSTSDLGITFPGSQGQTITMPSSFSLAANQALTAVVDRNSNTSIIPSVESVGSALLVEENKVVLFWRFGGTDVYAWNGEKIVNGGSYTSNQGEISGNKNIVIQDKAGVRFDITAGVFSYAGSGQVVIKIPGSSDTNYVDAAAINALTSGERTVSAGEAVWVRINRTASKVFNITTTNASYQDNNTAGALYITTLVSVPKDQDVFVLYSRDVDSFIKHHHADPVGNVYEETYTVPSPISVGGMVVLPLDSRNFNEPQYYVGGSGMLEVFLNGQRQILGSDYLEPDGSGALSNRIQTMRDLIADDVVTFRIGTTGAVYFTPAPSSVSTLQDVYDNGNTILTTSGRPVDISGPIGEKLLAVHGDMQVDGIVDPKAITFVPLASNPMGVSDNGLWVDTTGNLIQERPGMVGDTTVNVTQRIFALEGQTDNPSTFVTAGDALSWSASILNVNVASAGGIQISSDSLSIKLPTGSGLTTSSSGLNIVLEGSNPTLWIDGSNQLGVKLDAAGAIITGADGVGVQVDDDTIQIVANTLQVKNASKLFIVLTNNTGTTISAGSIVAADTTANQVVLASASSVQTAQKTLGVVPFDILDGDSGKVQIAGIATVLPGSFTIGQAVYLSTVAGNASSISPSTSGAAVFVLGVATSATEVHLNPYLVGVMGNIYEESTTLGAPVSSGGSITLPVDSRNGGASKTYVVGAGQLEVYLNGQRQILGSDYSEVSSSQIQILRDLVAGDTLTFRIVLLQTTITGSGGGSGTLQDAYLLGNTISTVSGTPLVVGGSATKVAQFLGDIEVTGVIDPKGMTLIPQSSSPLGGDPGIWINSAKELVLDRGDAGVQNITQVITALSNPTYLNTIMINDSGFDIAALSAVSISASTGNLYFSDVTSESLATSTIGIAVNQILNGNSGEIATHGRLTNIVTSFNYGDVLYVNHDGNLTNIKPSIGVGGFASGDWVVKIGTICKNASSVLVKDIMINVQVIGQL